MGSNRDAVPHVSSPNRHIQLIFSADCRYLVIAWHKTERDRSTSMPFLGGHREPPKGKLCEKPYADDMPTKAKKHLPGVRDASACRS